MSSGYKFPILDSSGNPTSNIVDMKDMFVPKELFNDSGIFSWGYNGSGQLGLDNTSDVSSPVQVGSLTNWKSISNCLSSSYSIKTNGTLWSWGQNTYGQLGVGDTTNRSSPVQVGTLTNWKQVYGGREYILGINTDGTLWSWGQNTYGQLGVGDTTNRSSPVQVGSLTEWKQVSTSMHSLGIKTDGTLWSWGYNNVGQLGLGDITHRSSPVQVGSLTNWKYVSCGFYHTLGIKTDGTLWSWGQNNFGQLGLGNITHRSSPVQVGSLTNWKQVSCGSSLSDSSGSSLGISSDGTLWSWGNNTYGQLGLGDITHRSSPVQVGSLTNWKFVDCGMNSFSCAIKLDRTMWCWGRNSQGQLGLGDITHRSSPVQVGSFTNWKQVSTGEYYGVGITLSD